MCFKDVPELCGVGKGPYASKLHQNEDPRYLGLSHQGQEVGAKHINEIEMFQMTSREPMEPIDEEAGDLANLEDVSESKHANETTERTEDVNEENDE